MVGQLFARLADGKLGKELEANLPLLFTGRSARVVNNDEREYATPRPFDRAVATVATPDLDLRFVRAGSELSIEVAIPGERDNWRPVNWSQGLGLLDWAAVDRLLNENWPRVE